MTSTFDDVYHKFLGLVEGFDLMTLDESDAYDMMSEWLNKVLSLPKIRKLFASVSVDNTVQLVTYTLRNPIDDDFDKAFVTSLLANGMVVEWLGPRVYTDKTLRQGVFGKEQKMYAQSTQMNSILSVYNKAKATLEKDYARDQGYAAFVIKGSVQ